MNDDDSLIDFTEAKLKKRRQERGREIERDFQAALQDRSVTFEARAELVLRLLEKKICDDINEQFEYAQQLKDSIPITPSAYARIETERLLRMLEKRKAMLDDLQPIMLFDWDLQARAKAALDASARELEEQNEEFASAFDELTVRN